MQLLQTIKVPKNLLYLTDRLPKPVYEAQQREKKAGKSKGKTRHTSADIDNDMPFVQKKPHY